MSWEGQLPNPFEPLLLRIAEPGDAAQLSAFMRAQFTAAFGAVSQPGNLAAYLNKAYGTAQQTAELSDPAWTTWLLETSNKALAAYLQVRRNSQLPIHRAERQLEIHRFYVDRIWHGHGVARTMMHLAICEATRLKLEGIVLQVWGENHRALAFYRNYGFIQVANAPFRLGADSQTDLVVWRPLNSAQSQ